MEIFGWYAYQIDSTLDVSNLDISCDTYPSILGIQPDNLNLVLTNYSEDGTDACSPKNEIIKDKYLVFSRGGYFYGLYDLISKETLVNVINPSGEYRELDDRRKNIHGKIDEIIKS